MPLAPVATITICPSFTPQLLGFVGVTLVILGVTGAVKISSASDTTQVPSIFLTRIS